LPVQPARESCATSHVFSVSSAYLSTYHDATRDDHAGESARAKPQQATPDVPDFASRQRLSRQHQLRTSHPR
jgi:hypothetical protein